MLCCTKPIFVTRKALRAAITSTLIQPALSATPEIAQALSCLAPNSISFARGGSAKNVLPPPQPISCLQRLSRAGIMQYSRPESTKVPHHAAQGLLHGSSGTNCRRATAVGIRLTEYAPRWGYRRHGHMPPERHAAQPHPWLGGCRAQHPSKPTTQEPLLGKLTSN
jgi:hypothetical protein